ncbi:MAG: heme NO-binding domain-containing protein, partial [Planctomycetaceae bacterium]
MHGTVFFHLHRYAEQTWGQNIWSQLFVKAGLTETSYSPAGVHPDEDIVALVNAAAELTGLASAEILARFGEYLAPELVALFPSLVDANWQTLDLIANAEHVIHEAVRAQNPDASPPVLRAQM